MMLDGDVTHPLPSKGVQHPRPLLDPYLLWPNGRLSQLLLTAEHLLKVYLGTVTRINIMCVREPLGEEHVVPLV